ncbi:MAG TPA: alpha/beta hydrolase [Ktedonobacterales bacterium]|nr:alpha/beta hydrolase [Ktedonobacterales bacterium]
MASVRTRIVRAVYGYLNRERGGPPRPFPEQRAALERTARLGIRPRGTVAEAVAAGGVPAEWVSVPTSAPDRVLLYLHGGSYTIGSPRSHRALVAQIARAAGVRALALDYRLAPEHRFPAPVEDATAAYRWLLAQGNAPERIVIAGDSAGGGLTLATALALRDAGDPLPAALVCLSPWTDLAATGASLKTRAQLDPALSPNGIAAAGQRYVGPEGDTRAPLASPLYADLRGLPPTLIQVGDHEILLDDSTRLAERARAAGVAVTLEVWPEMWHVFEALAGYLPEADQAIGKIGAFMRARLAEPATPA